jgi:hypothetical protein
MTPTDLEFHNKLLRLFKGALKAYEDWLNKKKEAVT